MGHYSMTPDQVLATPIRLFWLLNKNIDRLNAEDDMRMLMIMGSHTSSEAFQTLQEALAKRVGKIASFDKSSAAFNPLNAKQDKEGLMKLKMLAARMAR